MRPHTSYLICATQRSGSTLLCELLKNTHLAGYPEEYFDALRSTGVPQRPLEYFAGISDETLMEVFEGRTHPDEEPRQPPPGSTFERYVETIIEKCTSPNGVFGTKLMWNYFPDFVSKLRDIPCYHDLPTSAIFTALFPDLHYIFVTRRDKLGQAISLWKGLQTWTWRAEDNATPDGQQKKTHKLIFHFAAIDHLVQMLERNEQGWQRFFAQYRIQPLQIVFEDLIASKEETARAVLQSLNIPIPQDMTFASSYMRRQADEVSAAWAQQYYAMKQGVVGGGGQITWPDSDLTSFT